MKKLLLFASLTFYMAVMAQPQSTIIKETKYGTLHKFSANPQKGYNFDYLLYLPVKLNKEVATRLMVECNNTGRLSDSIQVHEKAAISAASRSGVALYVAEKLGLPLLVPIFPRPESNWQLYTHALDRETFLTKEHGLERLDLQLLAMAAEANAWLKGQGYNLKDKFFITGFSASGTFANRFSLLHPDRVQATASGGINAIVMLPLAKLEGKVLSYPLGIADVKKHTGVKVNLKAFTGVPKLLYMGELDENDAAAFDDAYSATERSLIYDLMGRSLKERWAFMEKIYSDNKISADFRTYKGIGHGTDLKINNDITEFFRKHMD